MGVYYSDHFECWRSRLRLLWGSQKIIYDFNISKKSSSQFVLLLNFNFASLSTSERRQHSCSTQMHRNISIPQVSNLKFQSSQTMSVQMHFLCFCFNSNAHFPILLMQIFIKDYISPVAVETHMLAHSPHSLMGFLVLYVDLHDCFLMPRHQMCSPRVLPSHMSAETAVRSELLSWSNGGDWENSFLRSCHHES